MKNGRIGRAGDSQNPFVRIPETSPFRLNAGTRAHRISRTGSLPLPPMAKSRFYIPAERWNPEHLVLDEEEAHHCLDVMRCREGDRVIVFNGAGSEAEAEIVATAKGSVTVRRRSSAPHRARPPRSPSAKPFRRGKTWTSSSRRRPNSAFRVSCPLVRTHRGAARRRGPRQEAPEMAARRDRGLQAVRAELGAGGGRPGEGRSLCPRRERSVPPHCRDRTGVPSAQALLAARGEKGPRFPSPPP